ncbi:2-amino-4-hydroxy-6-hydroxymethyldihydropteridine diphosphokinase [Synechococcus sp. GFB01]|uniref:2-amino-4-hydroxy-6- hydroxymethyldihydropteridine diphosphokinase n=1 Tax=Synechococcus sp. GFB01 TaxID=1662190 RepID=UPI000AF6A547|nr:2-amino-4-hydroxy-6-hydroxymethyldihydropteridine diphosphokinase [Synechococcus sp. GFB01]
MCASLADQSGSSLAIALGANLPSPAGDPLATLLAVRPQLERRVQDLGGPGHWSPLFRTAPLGGPAGQPDYLNAVLLLRPARPAGHEAARDLLKRLQHLEQAFARQRHERWGPRSLDLDLLWWGDLVCDGAVLQLPHPCWQQRSFVVAPLAAIAADFRPPGAAVTTIELLNQLLAGASEPPPERLPGRPGWPE